MTSWAESGKTLQINDGTEVMDDVSAPARAPKSNGEQTECRQAPLEDFDREIPMAFPIAPPAMTAFTTSEDGTKRGAHNVMTR